MSGSPATSRLTRSRARSSVAGAWSTVTTRDSTDAAASARLGGTGRVLVRASGTEPVVRVMVEAATEEIAAAVASELAGAVERRYSADR